MTRLLPLSLTSRFPFLSNDIPDGLTRPLWLTLSLPEVKAEEAGWPSSNVAAMPFEKGGAYSSTRLFPLSATHKLPVESTAIPAGRLSVESVGFKALLFALEEVKD